MRRAGGDILATDHFEEQGVIGFEAGVELRVVALVRDVDGADQIDGGGVLAVAGDGGLEACGGGVLVDADEILRLGGERLDHENGDTSDAMRANHERIIRMKTAGGRGQS
jgi:hypothetical protein